MIFLINVKNVKFNFMKHHPQSLLSAVMKQAPDMMTSGEFLATVAAWLAIIDEETAGKVTMV